MKLLNIGFGNLLSLDRIISILSPDSSPIKRIIQDAKEKGNIIDASQGRKTKSVIITDSNHVVLSALNPEILMNRISENFSEGDKLEDEL